MGGSSSIEQAIFKFSGLYEGPVKSDWLEITSDYHEQFPLNGIFGATHLDGGRVVANQASWGFGNIDVSEERTEADARFSFITSCIPLIVGGYLLPGMRALLAEHAVPLNMMKEIAYRSELVPEHRENLIGLGLHKGFEYDFPTAVHILAPQLESIVRNMVQDRGGDVSTIDPVTSVEKFIALGSLLAKPEAEDALGEDLKFEIQSIFTDQRGPNLRNDVAHGEMNDFNSQNEYCFYAWWMMLRVLCASIMHPTMEDDD